VKERRLHRLRSEKPWLFKGHKNGHAEAREVSALRGRVEALEAALRPVLQPTPDFDDGWTDIDAHSSIVWMRDEKRRITRLDVLIKTGAEEFDVLPTSPQEGKVWFRPWPPQTPFEEATQFVIYNRSDASQIVRVQGWYEARPGD